MKWRDAVKLAVAKRLFAEKEDANEYRYSKTPRTWDEIGPPYQDEWLGAADIAIKAVREGCKDAGVNVVFEVSDETFRIKAEVHGHTQLETGTADSSDCALRDEVLQRD